jgi:hypothetical protein
MLGGQTLLEAPFVGYVGGVEETQGPNFSKPRSELASPTMNPYLANMFLPLPMTATTT